MPLMSEPAGRALRRWSAIAGGVAVAAEMSFLGWRLAHWTARRRARSSLHERLRFEAVLSELSTGLIHAAAGELEGALERGLRQVAAFLGVDRATLDAYADGGPGSRVVWAAPGVPTRPPPPDDAELPWTVRTLQQGEVVRFGRPEELPEAAAVDRVAYARLGVRSHVSIPLQAGGPVLGALAFDAVRRERAWPEALVGRLAVLSKAFASALERRRMERSLAERSRFERDLMHVGRVSAMGELVGSLAHELNQPLTAILANAQAAQRLLAAGPGSLDELQEILDDIVADDRRATDVIRSLRRLLSKGDGQRAPLDLNGIVDDVARLVRADTAGRRVAMSLELGAGLPRVHGDRVQLQQVVLNLVLNGLDSIRARGAGDRTLVVRTAAAGAAAVRLEVQDSGIGIDDQAHARIFEPLYTTKADGLGMGLAIVRTIVDAHGGRVAAANNPAGGATFGLTLPAHAEDAR